MVKFSRDKHAQILCVIHAFTRILGSVTGPLGNGLVPDGTNPLPELMLI